MGIYEGGRQSMWGKFIRNISEEYVCNGPATIKRI